MINPGILFFFPLSKGISAFRLLLEKNHRKSLKNLQNQSNSPLFSDFVFKNILHKAYQSQPNEYTFFYKQPHFRVDPRVAVEMSKMHLKVVLQM